MHRTGPDAAIEQGAATVVRALVSPAAAPVLPSLTLRRHIDLLRVCSASSPRRPA